MTRNVITLPVNPCLPVNHDKMLSKHGRHQGNKLVRCEHCGRWWKASATFCLGWTKVRWYHFKTRLLIQEQLAEMRLAETRAVIDSAMAAIDNYHRVVRKAEQMRRIGKAYPYAEDSLKSEDRLVKHLKNNRW